MLEYDKYLYFDGTFENAYKFFGAHIIRDNKNVQTVFRVYAPFAKAVNLACEKNFFNGSTHPLTKDEIGVWSITFNEDLEWMMYKYEIIAQDGTKVQKTDPYGFYSEYRPGTASKVYDIDHYCWNDSKYINNRKKPYENAVNIYEMHLGSWMRHPNNTYYKYNEMVPKLVDYLKDHNFNYVEFMPVYEHPLDMSWGYQGGCYFSATSRFGVPKDLMYLIDKLHQANIGVIFDFVLGHVIKDQSYLYKFDGTHLYEYDDEFRRENKEWGTANLDFSKGHTKSYMLSAFHFYMEYFHVDGFRIDAVSNLLYYLGNKDNGINNEAISFIRQISASLAFSNPSIIFSAEDSSAHANVTGDPSTGAVGFNYKWNMGFMNDSLKYFKLDPIYRKFHHNLLTFGIMYTYSEQFILPYSHDEVVHMKGSLINKMPGDYNFKFQQLKLLMTLLYTYPGKKLVFMGGEFGQFSEWNFDKELDWSSLMYESHQKYNYFFKQLTLTYMSNKALYVLDHDPKGFKWIDANNAEKSIYSYARFDKTGNPIVVILNMTPEPYENFIIGVPKAGEYETLLDSTQKEYYGWEWQKQLSFSSIDGKYNNLDQHIKINIKPFGAYILKYKKGSAKKS
ncbi:MAG: 1,4-alpha-glucan branching protein GlgB [Acholeplasmatales bacterium]|jgi:1,4-alpha-glucan branching enzyme|nr:1,4-alpha-glucan branching protein GlgB [Acholeplasmatales bacterium]